MAKKKPNNRIPRASRSPYNPSFKSLMITGDPGEYYVEKMKEPQEPELCPTTNAVQGCGLVGCPICMPAGGFRAADIRVDVVNVSNAFPDLRDSSYERMQREAMAAVYRGMNERIFGDTFRGFGIDMAAIEPILGTATKPSTQSEADKLKAKQAQQRAILERNEAAAREPVEKYILKGEHSIAWGDIIGNEDAHRAMIEAIEFPVKFKDLYKFYNKKTTKGIMLSGPPGCGKTMFGKAAASVIGKLYDVKASMLSIKASELQTPYVGQTEKIIREVFAYARAYKDLHGHQLIIFIDEADAILPRRDGLGRRTANWEQSNVAAFLSEMDGLEESGALVILATNRPEAIDTAILRDGRIDRKIVVERPNEEAARVILRNALEGAPIYEGDYDRIVSYTIDMLFSPLRHLFRIKHDGLTDFLCMSHVVSGSMMVGLVERAKANAFHRDIKAETITGITRPDIAAAVEALTEEQRKLPDVYALTELAQRFKASSLEVEVAKPEIKFTGTLQ